MKLYALEQHVVYTNTNEPVATFGLPDDAQIMSVQAFAGPETQFQVVTLTPVQQEQAPSAGSPPDAGASAPAEAVPPEAGSAP